MYLYMSIDYVMLYTYDYGYVCVLVYILYTLMFMLMLHPDMHCPLYSLSRHHLASTLAQSDLDGCGFTTFHGPLQMGFMGG